jgi:hypothetical protein
MAKTQRTKAAAAPSEELSPREINQQVIDIIEQSEQDILLLLDGSAYSLHKAVVSATLSRLKFRFRIPGQSIKGHERKKFDPIIPRNLNDHEKIAPVTLATQELDQEVNAIYDGFAERETDELIDSLTDLQIRGVAKAAGLEVTETKPSHMTPSFVEEIKAAIVKKQQTKALVSDPGQVLISKIEATEKEVADLAAQKSVVEQALEKETDPVKKEKLSLRLSGLTEKETALYSELEQLNNALTDAPDQD